jgi:amidase
MDAFMPAWRLADMARGRQIGCLEALDFYIGRVERLDGALNAVIVRDFDRARAKARMLDNRSDRTGKLFGVPMTVKESFDLRGHPTCWGFAQLGGHKATTDAVAVRRLEHEGAIVFGKTNVPVGLGDWQSYNPVYGATSNPWSLAHTPGGSSGGGAAACAAGFGGLELGSDIGGSIRVPAHFCGLFGHKPSWGLASPRGHSTVDAAAMTDISVIGPMARSSRDLATALEIITGPDPDDSGLGFVLPPARTTRITELRVAVWSHEAGQATDRETVALIERAGRFLAAEGATVSFDARPAFDPAAAYHLFLSLLDAALGARMPPAMVERRRAAKAALRAGDLSANAVMLRATGMEHGTWLALHERRAKMRLAWSAFFRDWDVLLCPVIATPALAHQHEGDMASRELDIDGRTVSYSELLFWPGITCGFHLPASVAPLGLSGAGLPIGVQIAGPLHGDLTTLAVAGMLEQRWRGFTPPPFGQGMTETG